MSMALKQEILDQLDRLSRHDRQKVLDFARWLAERRQVRGVPAQEILAFFRSLPPADPVDLQVMSEAIEADCEQVDPDAW